MTAILEAIISFFKSIGLIYDPSVAPQFSSGGEPFYISFEGLGIDWFKMNPVAIPILNGVRWYGILITLGIVLAVLYVCYRAGQWKYNLDDLIDGVLIVVPLGVLGARLFYVFTADGFDLSKWYRIWDGGLAIYGAIIAGILALILLAGIKKLRLFRLMDCTAPAVMIAQSLGRWGNFCNGEAFGAEYHGIFRMGLSHDPEGGRCFYVHPTFLYESLWNLTGFILINLLYKKKKFDGQITLMYLGWYGLGRFFIELLRQDSLDITFGSQSLRISSVIGFVCFVLCTILIIIFSIRPKSPALALPSYYPGSKRYAEVTGQTEEEAASENDSGDAPEVLGDFAESGAEDLSSIGEEAQEKTAENAAESVTESNE
jgi:phosphatidylglycerol:prolipoprotein diacylglycerol transferase